MTTIGSLLTKNGPPTGNPCSDLRAHPEHIEQVAADFDRVDTKRIETGIDEVDAGPLPCRRALELRQRAVVHEA